jgi:acetylornithine/succinyldiaminopimelate/putrescine aminotransferase
MNFEAIKNIEDRFQVPTYKKMNIAVKSGSDSWIETADGERYLDLYGGHAVCATGHCHPKVVAAIKEQAEQMLFYSNLVFSETRAKAAEKLASVAPKGLTKIFFCNSGTEANENAMRIARLATGRENIVSFGGGFHGRTADSISATFLGRYRDIGRPNVPGHFEAKFGDIESVRAALDDTVAAVLIEPIQSMNGVTEAAPEFFIELREACDDAGAMLIFDEVQTGVGRTGNWFFAGSELAGGIVPDVVTLAKSLGSGVPVGACLINESVSQKINLNDLGTTFGGGMLAMAAVIATLEAIGSDEMIANAKVTEMYLRLSLEKHPSIRSIRGKGCLIGLEFDSPCAEFHARLLDKKIITGTSSDPNVLRLLPPLNVSVDDLELLVNALWDR